MAENNQHSDQPYSEPENASSPFIEYLQTEKGHQMAARILGMAEDFKKMLLYKSGSHSLVEKWQLAIVIFAIVGAVTVLTLFDKFDPAIGILFGVLVGYIIGKKGL
ncbi:MAG: hypothetical protein PVH97_12850 [Desulfobacterales bacterium]|jgi:hypothetical protein